MQISICNMTEEIEKKTFYYPGGNIYSEVYYKGEVFHGPRRDYYENGILAYECTYIEGAPDGVIRQWDPNGNLIAESHFINGTGTERIWDNTNKSWSELSWVNGTWTGRFRVYWSDGSIAGDTYWVKNRQVSKKKYIELSQVDESLPKYENLAKELKQPKKKVKKVTRKQIQTDVDPFFKKLFENNQMTDAYAWLTQPGVPERTLGECTRPEDSIEMVKVFLDMGAVNIWTYDIEGEADEEQNSGKLVIELPNDPEQRKNILDKCGEIAQESGFDPEPDTGQKYTFLLLD